jgi:hypothetical protein
MGPHRRTRGTAAGSGFSCGVPSAAATRRAVALLSLFAAQGLCWVASLSHGVEAGWTHGPMGWEDADVAASDDDGEGFGPVRHGWDATDESDVVMCVQITAARNEGRV